MMLVVDARGGLGHLRLKSADDCRSAEAEGNLHKERLALAM